jgi:serine/threonine protein kinase
MMEYCPNGSVLGAMDRYDGRKLPINEIRRYMFELAQAVRYMHGNIIVHRDLKPHNMLLDKDNHVKLCDFGLSTSVSRLKLEGNTICGTPNYIPPEVYNQKGVTTQADVWSFGCVLFTLLVGVPPFTSYSKDQTEKLITSASYSMPPDIDPDAADLIRQLLHPNQNQRPQFAQILGHPFFVEKAAVQPQRCPFKGGHVDVMKNGEIVLDIVGHPTLFRIRPGKNEIEVETRSGSQQKIYQIGKLPAKYQSRYEFAMKIVRQAEQHRPLVIWNTPSGKYVLFGNQSLGLVRGKTVMPMPADEKSDLRTAMLAMVATVQNSGYSAWPIVIGPGK